MWQLLIINEPLEIWDWNGIAYLGERILQRLCSIGGHFFIQHPALKLFHSFTIYTRIRTRTLLTQAPKGQNLHLFHN